MSRVLQAWMTGAAAILAMGWGGAVAEAGSHLGQRASMEDQRLERLSPREFVPGDWVLVQPADMSSTGRWQLGHVQSVGVENITLDRSLVGRYAEVWVRRLALAPQGRTGGMGLDVPRSGATLSERGLYFEGRVEAGDEVVLFVDGVEEARLTADGKGRFAGTLERGLKEGLHQLQLLEGSSGDWSLYAEPTTIVILAAPPTPVVLQPQAGAFLNTQQPLFRGTGTAGVTVIVALNGTDVGSTTVDGAGNWSFTPTSALMEASYTASIRARNAGGEESAAATLGFTVDVTPPSVIINQRPGDRSTNTSPTFRFTPSEFSTLECRLDNGTVQGTFQPCTSPYALSGLQNGVKTFIIRATDRAGNVDPNPRSVTWFVDTDAPTVEFVQKPETIEASKVATFTLGVTADDEEVAFYECILDGQMLPSFACGTTTILRDLADGLHTFEASATDTVGRKGGITAHSWTVDATPPGAANLDLSPFVKSMQNNLFFNRKSVQRFVGTAESHASVMLDFGLRRQSMGPYVNILTAKITADSAGRWSYTPSPNLEDGDYELKIFVEDAVKNRSPPTVEYFTIKTTVPKAEITKAPPKEDWNPTPEFDFNSPGEVNVTYLCVLTRTEEKGGASEGKNVDCKKPELSTGDGVSVKANYELEVKAVDEAGNVADPDAKGISEEQKKVEKALIGKHSWVYKGSNTTSASKLGCTTTGGGSLLPLGLLLAWRRRRARRPTWAQAERAGWGLALLLTLLSVPSQAQVSAPSQAQGIDLQRYKPGPGRTDLLGVYSPELSRDWGLFAGASVNYAHEPLRLIDGNSVVKNILSSQVTTDVLLSVDFLEYVQIGAAVPFTVQSGPTEPSFFVPEGVRGAGWGNLRVVVKVAGPLEKLPLEPLRLRGVHLGVALPVVLPFKDPNSFLGTSQFGLQPMVLAQWSSPSRDWRVLANVGYRIQESVRNELIDLNAGNEWTYGLGVQYAPRDSRWFGQLCLNGAVGPDGRFSSSRPLEGMLSGGFVLDVLSPGMKGIATAAIGPGILDGYGTPRGRGIIQGALAACPEEYRFSPEANDDGDEVVRNDMDACPSSVGNKENIFGAGCPESDEQSTRVKQIMRLFEDDDGDGILNIIDRNPRVPGTREYCGRPPPKCYMLSLGKPAKKEFDVMKSFVKKKTDLLRENILQDKSLASLAEYWKKVKEEREQLKALPICEDSPLKREDIDKLRLSAVVSVGGGEKLKAQRLVNARGLLTAQGVTDVSEESLTGLLAESMRIRLVHDTVDRKEIHIKESHMKETPCNDVVAVLLWSSGEVVASSEGATPRTLRACEGAQCDTQKESWVYENEWLETHPVPKETGKDEPPASWATLLTREGKLVTMAPGVKQQMKGSEKGFLVASNVSVPQEMHPFYKEPWCPVTKLYWDRVEGAKSYFVQVASGVDFISGDVRFLSTPKEELALSEICGKQAPHCQGFYWRVISVDKDGRTGQPSRIHFFSKKP